MHESPKYFLKTKLLSLCDTWFSWLKEKLSVNVYLRKTLFKNALRKHSNRCFEGTKARLCSPLDYTYIVLLGEQPVSLFFNSKGFVPVDPLRKMLPMVKISRSHSTLKMVIRQKNGERFYYILIGMTETSIAVTIKGDRKCWLRV